MKCCMHFFCIYCCTCGHCLGGFRATLGWSGHGSGWQQAGLAIEKSLSDLLGKQYNICRYAGMQTEYGPDFMNTVSRKILVEWDFQPAPAVNDGYEYGSPDEGGL
jgi:hypothetical protein